MQPDTTPEPWGEKRAPSLCPPQSPSPSHIYLSALDSVLPEAGPHFGNPRGVTLCYVIWKQATSRVGPACAHTTALDPPTCQLWTVSSWKRDPTLGIPEYDLPLLCDLDTDRQLLTASVSPSLKCEEWYQLRGSKSIC